MNKNELIAAVAEKTGVMRGEVVSVLNAFSDTIDEQVRAGNEVTIPGLGKLKVVERPGRQGRNPATGEPVTIPSKKAPRIVFSAHMKAVANGDI